MSDERQLGFPYRGKSAAILTDGSGRWSRNFEQQHELPTGSMLETGYNLSAANYFAWVMHCLRHVPEVGCLIGFSTTADLVAERPEVAISAAHRATARLARLLDTPALRPLVRVVIWGEVSSIPVEDGGDTFRDLQSRSVPNQPPRLTTVGMVGTPPFAKEATPEVDLVVTLGAGGEPHSFLHGRVTISHKRLAPEHHVDHFARDIRRWQRSRGED